MIPTVLSLAPVHNLTLFWLQLSHSRSLRETYSGTAHPRNDAEHFKQPYSDMPTSTTAWRYVSSPPLVRHAY